MPPRDQVINYAAQVAREEGLPPSWFLAMLHSESGFSEDVGSGKRKSSAGAIGYGQLMPGTARGLGVDPFDWKQNIKGSARYLKRQIDSFGNVRLGLSAYNSGPGGSEREGRIEQFPETVKYVDRVTQLEQQYRGFNTGSPAAPTAGVAGTTSGSAPANSPPETPRLVPATPAPGGAYLEALTRLGPLSGRVAGQAAKFVPRRPMAQEQMPAQETGHDTRPVGQGGDDWRNYVGDIQHRQGPSAPHTEEILQFVGRVGRRAKTVLTPWGNESHSLTTVNGKPSAHGPGRAADIPARGAENIRLGQLALIEAGADPKWARKQKGGLFNIGGYQIIFNTQIGGDHSDHVHTGLRG